MVLLGSIHPSGRHCWKFQGNLQFRLFKAIQRQSSCKIATEYSILFQWQTPRVSKRALKVFWREIFCPTDSHGEKGIDYCRPLDRQGQFQQHSKCWTPGQVPSHKNQLQPGTREPLLSQNHRMDPVGRDRHPQVLLCRVALLLLVIPNLCWCLGLFLLQMQDRASAFVGFQTLCPSLWPVEILLKGCPKGYWPLLPLLSKSSVLLVGAQCPPLQ